MAVPRQASSVVRYAVVGQGYIAPAAVLPKRLVNATPPGG